MDLTRKELIEAGVKIFQSSCHDVKMTMKQGIRWWHGRTCEGGGWYVKHKMNQDLMTPEAVAYKVGHKMAISEMKEIMAKAKNECNLAVMKYYGIKRESNQQA